MYFATFEDDSSPTYGATGDRPVISFIYGPDTAFADANILSGQTYITVSSFLPSTQYKISWSGTAWTLVARALLSTVATWNKLGMTADGFDTATLGTGLPNPSTVIVLLPQGSNIKLPVGNENIATVASGSFSLAANDAGVYTVMILDPWPYAGPYTQDIAAV